MKFNIFGDNKKEVKKTKKSAAKPVEQASDTKNITVSADQQVAGAPLLQHFYISEKSGLLNAMNQYVFKVAKTANKQEVKKQVAKRYNVVVKDVRMINVPRKRRDIGRHPGYRTGFRKAIVTLAPGSVIEQAKA